MADTSAMAEERRIVVAVDESEQSMYALRWFLKTLLPSGGNMLQTTLILLYARPPPPVFSPLDGTAGYLFSDEVIASMEKYSKDQAASVMERAEKICKDYENIKVEVKVFPGDARDIICDWVEKLGADMLVMGSHGYGFIKRALLGSVSDYCARNVKCPILIVKHRN